MGIHRQILAGYPDLYRSEEHHHLCDEPKMKRKEIFLVVVLILFGLTYHFFKSGDFYFFDACSGDSRSLLDKGHSHEFLMKALEFDHVNKLSIHNPAGNITFQKSGDNRVVVKMVKKVFHRKTGKAAEIEKNIQVGVNISGGDIDLNVHVSGKFPYQRARIFFQVAIPDEVELNLFNRYGDIEIVDCGSNIQIDEKYGDIVAKDISSDLNILHGYGGVTLDNINGNASIDSRYSTVRIYNAQAIKLQGKYMRTQIVGLKNGLWLKNSHEGVDISDVKGNINLDSKHCRIRLLNIDSDIITIRNSYDDVTVENLWAGKAEISNSHGNLNIKYFEIKEKMNIQNRYSNIKLEFSETISPLFNISLRYGKVVNKTQIPLSIINKKFEQIYSSKPGIPRIDIVNSYGDIFLGHTVNSSGH
jgi:hypothetical protein